MVVTIKKIALWRGRIDNTPGKVSSRSVHQYGSATSDRRSPHYADQSPLFARYELKPVYFDQADVRMHLSREYRPGGPDIPLMARR